MKQEEVNNNNTGNNSSNSNPMMSIESVCVELSNVYQVLSKCNDVIKSEEEVSAILPYCSDLLSEMYQMVQQAAASQQQQQQQLPEAELWWDSSPENVAYSECDTMYEEDQGQDCDQSSSLSVLSSDFSSDSKTSYGDSEAEEQQLIQEIYIDGMVEAISAAAPNNIFDAKKSVRKRKKRIMMTVPRVFRQLWRNCHTIFNPAPVNPKRSVKILSPTVDWTKVNGRFLSNLPKPELFPVLGCSEDPKFYQESYYQYDNRPTMTKPAKHDSPYPFGKRYGHMTQFGVVSLSSSVGDLSVPYQGYIYDQDLGWVIHAENPWVKDKKMDRENEKMRPKKMKMKSPRRRLR